jgi:hypothetical protein
MINEATICVTREYARTHRFSNANSNEGLAFVTDDELIDKIHETPIESIMVCFAHDSNTVPKEKWLKNPIEYDMGVYAGHLEIIEAMGNGLCRTQPP